MLSLPHRIAFLAFALVCLILGAFGFVRVVRQIRSGRADSDDRTNHPARRIVYALVTTLTQSRTFRKRPVVSFLHSWIFYGFTAYIVVNVVDALEGFFPFTVERLGVAGEAYSLIADILSGLVLLGVLGLVARRFFLPSRRDFRFNQRTLLHPDVRAGYITRDSLIVSAFILFHVGSRAVEMGAKIAVTGPDRWQPLATLLSRAIPAQHAFGWEITGYWCALGSILLFLSYFPFSKHIHLFMAPAKYAVVRDVSSGVLPSVDLTTDIETHPLGAANLTQLAWPRLLDAYACIQCNRCQDVCPATATGKSLSPSALEINKRMELNGSAKSAVSQRPLLDFALSVEAAWACTTCGACMQVCPVQDEPMLDIIDIRRRQVMMEGAFPAQLQTAFRGMERAKNPWGLAQDSRLAWANGLSVPTVDDNPNADVLYWVGCAASYDPQAQKTARALVQLLNEAGVNYAVLGKKECCTGDSARRAGNEALYQQLAETNIQTLRAHSSKQIIATCPHCMNSLGKEYAQLGGHYTVTHHTEFLDGLVKSGKLKPAASGKAVTFHDPCYLGRHNDVYDAPRNLLNVLSNDVRELDRMRENSFCCGAGGAQFWKEEEPGDEAISENRLREARQVLSPGTEEKVLAVGCPFCKSTLQSSSGNAEQPVTVMDVAELLWQSIRGDQTAPSEEKRLVVVEAASTAPPPQQIATEPLDLTQRRIPVPPQVEITDVVARPKWKPQAKSPVEPKPEPAITTGIAQAAEAPAPRKRWQPKASANVEAVPAAPAPESPAAAEDPASQAPATRKKWQPQRKDDH